MIGRDLVGVLLVLVVGGLFLAAWRSLQKQLELTCLALVLASGFLLRFFAASDLYLHHWDERYHALVAKHMLQFPFKPMLYVEPLLPFDYRDWTSNHLWVHKEPLALWMIVVSYAIFGVNEIALRLPGVLISTAAIGAVFLMVRQLVSVQAAFVAASLLAINGFLIELVSARAATDHVDTWFISLIAIGGYLAVRWRDDSRWACAAGIGAVAGLAGLAKSPVGFLVILLWLSMLRFTGPKAWIKWMMMGAVAGVVAVAVYLPWQLYIQWLCPQEATWEKQYTWRHMHEALEGHDAPLFYFFQKIPVDYGPLAVVALLWFVYQWMRDLRNRTSLMLMVWLAIPYTLFTIAQTKMDAYPMIAAPAVVTVMAMFYVAIYEWAIRNQQGWKRAIAATVLTLLLVLPVHNAWASVQPVGNQGWQTPWAAAMRVKAHEWHGRRIVVFNVKRYVELMFYTSVIAYPNVPTDEQLQSILDQGFEVYMVDGRDVPPEMKTKFPTLQWLDENTFPEPTRSYFAKHDAG